MELTFDLHIYSFFFIACLLRGKNLPGVQSRDLNSGLPYSRPAHYLYQLSHALLSGATPKNENTTKKYKFVKYQP
jgi:hypothetical protein